jgi:hypothetical protein
MRRRRRTATAGTLGVVAACALLIAAAGAQAKGSTFVLLSGPHIGDQIRTDGGPNVPDKLNPGHTEGVLVPQSGGNEFTFNGKVQAKRDNPPAAALPAKSVTKPIAQLAKAIKEEESALSDLSDSHEYEYVSGDLHRAIEALDAWKAALDSIQGRLGGSYATLVGKYNAAKSKDRSAQQEWHKDHHGATQRLVEEALKIKRDAAVALQEADIQDVLVPGLPNPADKYGFVEFGVGAANNITGDRLVVGQDTSGSPHVGALWNTNGSLLAPFTPISPGDETNGTAVGPEGHVGGTETHGSASWCMDFPDPYDFLDRLGQGCAIVDGSADGYAGFFLDSQNRERALWLKEVSGGGFTKVPIGDFPGGASLFTLNDRGLAFGDHFLSGDSGPFRAFRVKLNKPGHPTTELFRPTGGSSQPIASNDVGLAGGGAVTSGGAVLGTYWWGAQHYTRFQGEGGALINGMNEAGVGVGQIGPIGNTHAALFEGGQAYDLNDLDIPGGLGGMTLTKATDINDSGQIVGNGMLGPNQHGFLLQLAP